MIKIDSNVPAPKSRATKYPFADMKIGDSFFVEGVHVSKVAAAGAHEAKKSNTKYTCRTVDGGVRVWRVE